MAPDRQTDGQNALTFRDDIGDDRQTTVSCL